MKLTLCAVSHAFPSGSNLGLNLTSPAVCEIYTLASCLSSKCQIFVFLQYQYFCRLCISPSGLHFWCSKLNSHYTLHNTNDTMCMLKKYLFTCKGFWKRLQNSFDPSWYHRWFDVVFHNPVYYPTEEQWYVSLGSQARWRGLWLSSGQFWRSSAGDQSS